MVTNFYHLKAVVDAEEVRQETPQFAAFVIEEVAIYAKVGVLRVVSAEVVCLARQSGDQVRHRQLAVELVEALQHGGPIWPPFDSIRCCN